MQQKRPERTADSRRQKALAALASATLAWQLATVPAVPAAAGVLTGNCRVGNQPAATLLIPYFRVDLGNPGGATTLISVNNASAKPSLARVVLWTDWGSPTLAFDVYLTGYDVQSFNLRDLFNGTVPATGPAASHLGEFSATVPDFPGCGGSLAAPLTTTDRGYLWAAHTGAPLPGSGATSAATCLGSTQGGPGIATGYVTVDAVNHCTPASVGKSENTPADPLYFSRGGAGLASDNNVLWGDYFYIDPNAARSESQTAVAVVADPDFFSSGSYTFYGRYVGFDGRDDRTPLSSLYYARFFDGGAFRGDTDLVVWRDNRTGKIGPHPCSQGPDWAPLGEYQLVVFDEEENATQIPNSNAFPLTTQRVRVGSPALPTSMPYGWLMLDLWHQDGTHAQAWVTALLSAGGRFSSGHQALQVDDLCNFGP
ncbi:MAG TPA: hypothetical protein VMM92_01530 [Thermoanaerobaculia bacterium]|nr:hypothetical protein [Thermoanaerobaculia bacterium]